MGLLLHLKPSLCPLGMALVLMSYCASQGSASGPDLIPIAHTEDVVDWFLKHDVKIEDYRLAFADSLPKLRRAILLEIRDCADADSLQRRLEVLGAEYQLALVAAGARYEARGPLPNETMQECLKVLHKEAYLAAHLRVMGYFLLREHGIQPE